MKSKEGIDLNKIFTFWYFIHFCILHISTIKHHLYLFPSNLAHLHLLYLLQTNHRFVPDDYSKWKDDLDLENQRHHHYYFYLHPMLHPLIYLSTPLSIMYKIIKSKIYKILVVFVCFQKKHL